MNTFNISRMVREGRWTGHSPAWTDIAVLQAGVAVSRVDKAVSGSRRWLHQLQTAVGSKSQPDDIVWLLRMADDPQGLKEGRSLIFGAAIEKRWPKQLLELDDSGGCVRVTRYPFDCRPYDRNVLLPSPPAIDVFWIAADHEDPRGGWGSLLMGALKAHNGADCVSWRTPMPHWVFEHIKARSRTGAVLGWR